MADRTEACNCDQSLQLARVLKQLLRAIENPDDLMDSFERQYYCGELDDLLNEAFALVDVERLGR